MGYAVKELFKTLQGEGALAGRAAVFRQTHAQNVRRRTNFAIK